MKTLNQLPCLIGLLILSGCGFELQNTGNLNEKIDSVYIQTLDPYSSFFRSIKDALRNNGVMISDKREEASYVLVIKEDISSDRILSISAKNTPMEYEIAYQVVWSLFKGNQEIISDTKHIETQDYSFDQNQLLGKRKEAEYLNDSLASKISNGVLLKLGSI